MSLPKHATSSSPSSSPSRHSLRRPASSNPPSRPHSIDRPPTAQPAHHLPEEHHNEAALSATAEQEHGVTASTSQPPFQAFFTLIEDCNTSEYFHPTVHYIFSDDDSDIVTEAALRSLDTEQDGFPGNGKGKPKATPEDQPLQTAHGDEVTYDEDNGPSKVSQLPPPIPGVKNNYIILDMHHPSDNTDHPNTDAHSEIKSGTESTAALHTTSTQPQPQPPQEASNMPSQLPHHFKVMSADSLTPAWQVINTELAPAPTFEKTASGEQNGGLMLKIQGTSGLPINMPGKERDRSGQRLEDMMEQFSKRLCELRHVIEAGEEAREETAPEGLLEQPKSQEMGADAPATDPTQQLTETSDHM